MKVSIFCLVYNHANYLRSTLEGFVAQETNFDYEVFVHDDASTDGSSEIIMDYAKRFPDIIKPIIQTENQYSQGVRIVEQLLFPLMTGEYIACCEGDDYWCDNLKLQKQFDALEMHPECSMSTHLVACCNEDGSNNKRVIPEDTYNIKKECILSDNDLARLLWEKDGYPFHTSSYFMRRTVCEKLLAGMWTESSRDIDMLKAAALLGGVYYFGEVMSVRRLFVTGSWNDRLRIGGWQARVELCKKDLISDANYDIYSENKFHNIIVQSMLDRCFWVACEDVLFARNFIIQYNLRCELKSLKNWSKYLVLLCFPTFFKLKYKLMTTDNK